MTQNMDAGTDLGFALAYLNTSTPTVGIDLTYQEILQSDFAGRAAILSSAGVVPVSDPYRQTAHDIASRGDSLEHWPKPISADAPVRSVAASAC
jgi:hypothetical protein